MTDISPVYTNVQLKPLHLPPERSAGFPAAAGARDEYVQSDDKQAKKPEISRSSVLFNWGKGFVKGVSSYTIGLVLNPIKLALVLAAGVGGAVLLNKKGVSVNNAVKTELILVGAASAVKGVFDLRSYIKNKEDGKIDKAKKNIETFGKTSAHMCLPLAIPLVPAATKFFNSDKVRSFIKKTILKLI